VRLVSAVLILMLSVVTLATGVALRTVFAGPDSVERSLEIEHTAPALVIDGSVLTSYPGRQLITVYPDEFAEDDEITLVYGRTVDIMGWLRPARFTAVTYNPDTTLLEALPIPGTESTVPNPLGSDLWFEQYRDTQAVRVSLTAGEDISVAIFSTGQSRAPGSVELSWPIDNQTPFSALLIVLGGVLFIVGGILLAMSVTRIRKRRGPKRPKTVTAPKRRVSSRKLMKPRPNPTSSRGRRAWKMTAVVVIPVLGLGALTSCASDAPAPAPIDTVAETQPVAPAPFPAVTETQFQKILGRVARQVAASDEALDATLLEPRMAEPALTIRHAAYRLRSANEDLGTFVTIPERGVQVVVPQQSRSWPRTVFAVVKDPATAESPALGIVLRQESARTNYKLHYVVTLAPDTVLPSFPAPTLGTARLARESQLLVLSPEGTVTGYADILERGSESSVWGNFDVLTDVLFTVVGPEGQGLRQESFGSELTLDLSINEPEYLSIALATSDNGGIVFGVLNEVETVRPVQSGATVNATDSARVFSGLPESVTGFEAIYEIHVLWQVPATGSQERIRVLGYTYHLIDAREAPPVVQEEEESDDGS
jgi:hypothetical protein